MSLPLLTWANWMTDHLTWRVFKDSKKNEGLSGAAVVSDSVIMPLKILIVLAVCIGRLKVAAHPSLAHPALRGWKQLPVVRLECYPLPTPQMRRDGDMLVVETVNVSHTFTCMHVHFWGRGYGGGKGWGTSLFHMR